LLKYPQIKKKEEIMELLEPNPWDSETLPLYDFADWIRKTLQVSTGHDFYQRTKISYYIAATYFLNQYDVFSGLALHGVPSTGKTETLNAIKGLGFKCVTVTAESITPAALRQSMAEANNGTLIIEEAEAITDKELEALLITRYSRSSAHSSKMVSDGGKGWNKIDLSTFGATVLHRRNLFKEAALQRRVIAIRTYRVKGSYISYGEKDAIWAFVKSKLVRPDRLPDVTNQWDIEPGIFDCYRPVLAVATFLEDEDFISALVDEMRLKGEELRENEEYLEAPVFLKAIVNLAYNKVGDNPPLGEINIESSSIDTALHEEYGFNCPAIKLVSIQRNRIFRADFGFRLGSSHGRSRIYFTIHDLIKKCEEYGIG
jgi:hypothetical protein